MITTLVIPFVALGTLGILACNTLGTGFFFQKPPRGEYAVGLLPAFVVFIVAAALATLGSVLASLAPERAIAGTFVGPAWVKGTVTGLVGLGVVLSAFAAFATWAEPSLTKGKLRSFKAALCWLLGIIGPVGLAAVIIVDVSTPPHALRSHPTLLSASRVACWSLAALATLGYLACGNAARRHIWRPRGRVMQAAISRIKLFVRSRLQRGKLLDEVRRELDRLPANAPLSDMIVYFTNTAVTKDSDCRALLTQRALAYPEMDSQFTSAMSARGLRSRWGGFELVRLATPELLSAHEAPWSEALRVGILRTAEDMAITPMFLLDFELKPDPKAFVRSLLGAADRFRGSEHYEGLAHALRQLASDANELRPDKRKTAVARVLKRAGYPIPDSQEPSRQ